MIERGGRAGFPLKSLRSQGILAEIGGKEFKGDGTAQIVVYAAVDNTHPALPDAPDNAVFAGAGGKSRHFGW